MDPKNLAVLQQLKDSMHKEEPPNPLFTPLAIALLKDLANSFKPRFKKAKSSPTKPCRSPSPKAQQSARSAAKKNQKKGREEARRVQALKAELLLNKEKARRYRTCRECSNPVFVGDEIPLTPICCEHCKKRAREIDLGIKTRSGGDFTALTIVQGGAPGLGKRK